MGSLLPWNAILSVLDFFIIKMKGFNPASSFGFATNGLLVLS
jgi:hypothetical protein